LHVQPRHAGSAANRHGGPRIQLPDSSALVRPSHKLHGVFDMPPGSGEFDIALGLELDGIVGSFRNGLGAMGF
jgi:hypothetical protein